MADEADESSVKIDIGLGAKAEAKLNVKTEIPSSSVGRMVDAVTDMFRPFSERRGLKGDQIRLQREEVAIDIARLAKHRLEIERAEILPVPNKILIPLIEKSSQEDADDELMKKRWAELLASASMNKGVHPRMVQIMSEITNKEASLLEEIALNEYEDFDLPYMVFSDSVTDLSSRASVRGNITECLLEKTFEDETDPLNIVQDLFNRPGGILYLALIPTRDGGFIDGGLGYKPDQELIFDLCEGLGLLRRVEFDLLPQVGERDLPLSVMYYHLSEVGRSLIELASPDTVEKLRVIENENRARVKDREGHTYPFRSSARSEISNSINSGHAWRNDAEDE